MRTERTRDEPTPEGGTDAAEPVGSTAEASAQERQVRLYNRKGPPEFPEEASCSRRGMVFVRP